MMTSISGGVCTPHGFRAGAAAAGIKKPGSTRPDCALIVSERPATVAGTFTTNVVCAAPVRYTRTICERGVARAIFVNSGNANACTGERGQQDVLQTAEFVGKLLGIPSQEICIASTGVIGVPLPMDRILEGIKGCVDALSEEGNADAARAIMTTDTVPKSFATEVAISGGIVRIGGIAKGAGMIAPTMATMLCFLATDANVAPEPLRHALRSVVDESFNCICIDNDMSTNDMVLILANGASETSALVPGTADFVRFTDALRYVCTELAKALVRDGEGATKFVEIEVMGTSDSASAKQVAASVARSQLCKTAFYGQDANWGRIACAVGYSGVNFDPANLTIYLQGIQVLSGGCPVSYREHDLQERMKEKEIHVRIDLNHGLGQARFWTSDLSVDYVKINADYRS